METRRVVTCFLAHRGKILIVRRSEKVGTYRGKWSAISGHVEKPPEEQARQEIREEAGLAPGDFRLLYAGETLEVVDRHENIRWIVHPFLFEIGDPVKVRLDWENVEARWIMPSELTRFDTVPKLKEALQNVMDAETKRDAVRSKQKHRQNP